MTQVETGLRERVVEAIERERARIVDVAMQIHARPELGFEEQFASQLLADVRDAPARVRVGAPELPGVEVQRRALELGEPAADRGRAEEARVGHRSSTRRVSMSTPPVRTVRPSGALFATLLGRGTTNMVTLPALPRCSRNSTRPVT